MFLFFFLLFLNMTILFISVLVILLQVLKEYKQFLGLEKVILKNMGPPDRNGGQIRPVTHQKHHHIIITLTLVNVVHFLGGKMSRLSHSD